MEANIKKKNSAKLDAYTLHYNVHYIDSYIMANSKSVVKHGSKIMFDNINSRSVAVAIVLFLLAYESQGNVSVLREYR